MECEAGKDRHLGRGVGAVDVVGRVGLGVAELLRAGQGLVVGGAGGGHLAEDEVRRPVDDPGDLVDREDAEALLDARMIGITPATAASKRSWTPALRAASKSSSPCWARSSCSR